MKKTLISALSVLFIVILFTDANSQIRREMRDRTPYLHEKLNLTPDQESKLDELRDKHQAEMIDLRAELDKARLENQKVRRAEKLNRSEVLNQTKKMNEIKNKMAEVRANHFMDVQNILTDEQRKIWNDWKSDRPGYRDFHKRGNFERGMRDKRPCLRY